MDASLSDAQSINEAIDATGKAISIEQAYGFNGSSGCTTPQDFLLAEGAGVSCISYDAAGTISVSVPDSAAFLGLGPTTIYKTSWATILASGTATLCSGPPSSGNCN